MHLSLVEVKNFRSFESLRCDLRSGLNVLVGRNNTGKTTLLHAIRHAIGPAGSQGEALWLDRDDFFRESDSDLTERTIEITLTFSDLTDKQRAYFYEIVDFDLANLANSKAIIRFEASWPKDKRQASVRRLAGPPAAEAIEVPARILESLPITFLPALRDAEASLAPGYRSRLATVLRAAAGRRGDTTEEEIAKIYKIANQSLEVHPLIATAVTSLQTTTADLAGTDYSKSSIRAASVEFDKILRSLLVQMDGVPIGDLAANGLGYNNLLYVAVVLQHLAASDPAECPIFLVEEPEAHLHPQLTVLLADYLATKTPGAAAPQTLLTTHSPTIAATVPPDRLHILFAEALGGRRCNSLSLAGMTAAEQDDLQRMMDVTRAALYFAKGAILVEGICEAMLVPVLARALGYDLAKMHVSVIPICGVGFQTFKKLLDPKAVGIPVAIVTDGDPPVRRGTGWAGDIPEVDGGTFKRSANATGLEELFDGHPTVKIFTSQVTLEFDLADAGESNADLMAEVWEDCFEGNPRTFNRTIVADLPTKRDRALATWRGICRAEHAGSKARFAQRLAGRLRTHLASNRNDFTVPSYLAEAIEHVATRLTAAGAGFASTSDPIAG